MFFQGLSRTCQPFLEPCLGMERQRDPESRSDCAIEWLSSALQICLCPKSRGLGSSVKSSAVYLKAGSVCLCVYVHAWVCVCVCARTRVCVCTHPCVCWGSWGPSQVFLALTAIKMTREVEHTGLGIQCWSWGPPLQPLFSSSLAVWPWTRFFPFLCLNGLICKMSIWTIFSPQTLLVQCPLIFWSWLRPSPKVS